MSVSEQLLMAYADGELTPSQREAVEQAAAGDPAMAARLQAHLKLRQSLSAAFDPVLSEPVPPRLAAAVRPLALAADNVVPLRQRTRPHVGWWAVSGGLMAAGVALGFLVAPAFRTAGPASLIDPAMMAQGPLASALDHQLASAQEGRPIRIGVSFRTGAGQVCRTFTPGAMGGAAGLACHESAGWRVMLAAPAAGGAAGGYATAASATPPAISELAQSLAAGPAMDAAAEGQARASHWSAKP